MQKYTSNFVLNLFKFVSIVFVNFEILEVKFLEKLNIVFWRAESLNFLCRILNDYELLLINIVFFYCFGVLNSSSLK